MKRIDASQTKLDLQTAKILIVGSGVSELDILAQMLKGFGVPSVQRRSTLEDGMRAIEHEIFDLIMVDGAMPNGGGYQLVTDTRRSSNDHARHLPIILVCGHMRKSDIFKARDCGANFVVTKPLMPQILFDRIIWLASDERKFVECETYFGPDRRMKAFGPPVGMKGRRCDDLSEHVGEAREANLSQGAVDDFFGAKKVAL